MSTNSHILFIEIKKDELIFIAAKKKEKSNNYKLIYNNSETLSNKENNKFIDYNLIEELLKKKIIWIEQKFDLLFKEVILIIDYFEKSVINFSGFKILNGSQLTKENLTYIINSLKSKINEFEVDKKIIHIFNSNFFLDKKKLENLPIGLFGDFYSHELSFILMSLNDFKNLENIFSKCNLRIKRIISKSFTDGIFLKNENTELLSFIKIDINIDNSKLIFFENNSLKFVQDFNFGFDLVIRDIEKVTGLNKDLVEELLLKSDFSKQDIENNFIEKEFFKNNNYRKIKKKLILDVAEARIKEFSEIIISNNINLISFLKSKIKIFLKFDKKIKINVLFPKYKIFFSTGNEFDVNVIENFDDNKNYSNIINLVQFGWKSEAVPMAQVKKSTITRLFERIFN